MEYNHKQQALSEENKCNEFNLKIEQEIDAYLISINIQRV
jgi:hypothetical protein